MSRVVIFTFKEFKEVRRLVLSTQARNARDRNEALENAAQDAADGDVRSSREWKYTAKALAARIRLQRSILAALDASDKKKNAKKEEAPGA